MNTQRSPLETRVRRNILKALESRGGFWFHIHGSPVQRRGLPDIIGCYRGLFISFEVKRDADGKATDLQKFNMNKITQEGGVSQVIFSPQQALDLLDRIDRG